MHKRTCVQCKWTLRTLLVPWWRGACVCFKTFITWPPGVFLCSHTNTLTMRSSCYHVVSYYFAPKVHCQHFLKFKGHKYLLFSFGWCCSCSCLATTMPYGSHKCECGINAFIDQKLFVSFVLNSAIRPAKKLCFCYAPVSMYCMYGWIDRRSKSPMLNSSMLTYSAFNGE